MRMRLAPGSCTSLRFRAAATSAAHLGLEPNLTRRLGQRFGRVRRFVRAGNGHGDDVAGKAAERREEAAGILKAHHTDDEMQRLWRTFLEVGHRLCQCAPGGRVMAAVEPQLRARLE